MVGKFEYVRPCWVLPDDPWPPDVRDLVMGDDGHFYLVPMEVVPPEDDNDQAGVASDGPADDV